MASIIVMLIVIIGVMIMQSFDPNNLETYGEEMLIRNIKYLKNKIKRIRREYEKEIEELKNEIERVKQGIK